MAGCSASKFSLLDGNSSASVATSITKYLSSLAENIKENEKSPEAYGKFSTAGQMFDALSVQIAVDPLVAFSSIFTAV